MAIKHITEFRQMLIESIEKATQTKSPILFSHVDAFTNIEPLEMYHLSEQTYKGERFYWKNPDGNLVFAGIGSAYKIQSNNEGKTRFQDVQKKWSSILEQAIISNEQYKETGTGPIAFGGFSFNSKQTLPNTLWDQFGTYLFYIPRFLLTKTNGKLYLTSTILLDGDFTEEEMDYFIHERTKMIQLSAKDSIPAMPAIVAKEEKQVEDWKQSILRSVSDIKRGEMDKIVLARELTLKFASHIPSARVLENLLDLQKGSFVFSLESADDCFIGASPERLVQKNGKTVFSACLAGSIARGENEQADLSLGDELLNDDKNLVEHQFVVDMIRKAMEELCLHVDIPTEPRLMKLRNIQHLYTPVKGTSLSGTTILDFVERLHPTPALGGLPRVTAMERIELYESMPRGFYAAPIGWIDSKGNGDFAVGIRSALLKGENASLFAGCGIVAKSDPDSEYRETKVKFKPMLTAMEGKKQ